MANKNLSPGYDNGNGYLFIAPWLLGFLTITLVPMVLSLVYSFTDYDLLSPPVISGWKNYRNLLTDVKFHQALKVTLIFVAITIPLRLGFALAVALLLNTRNRKTGIYRTAFYLPSLVGSSVAIAVVWRQLFSAGGPVALLLNWLPGVKLEKSLVGSPDTALGTIVALLVWQFGSSMLIFLAGLKNIPRTQYEVATLDGAGRWRQFLIVTLPFLSPVLIFNLIMTLINSFMIFTQAYIVTEGGPMDSTLFLILYVFRKAFQHFHMGYASALSWVILIILSLFIALVFRFTRRWVYYAS